MMAYYQCYKVGTQCQVTISYIVGMRCLVTLRIS